MNCRAVYALLAISLLNVAVGASAQDKAGAKYKALVDKLKSGETSIDFTELRQAYADCKEFVSETDSDLRKEMYSDLNKADYEKAIAAGKKALDDYYLDIDAHQVLYLAYRDTNQSEAAAHHQNIVRGLIGAILSSGDGKTEDKAYVVNSTREEYIVLQVHGLFPGKQSLLNRKEHSYDVMVGVNPKTKENLTLYFNIDRPMRALRKALGKG